MFERFIKALEYVGYCRTYQVLRQQGLYKEAEQVLKYKRELYA